MELYYRSTRDSSRRVTASQAVLQGLSTDGGLFVPEKVPALPVSIENLAGLSYQETAFSIMRVFLTDYTDEELRYCIEHAYDEKFDTPDIAPLRKAGSAWYLELFHGKTIAFKDMALSILPYLMTTAAKKNQVSNEIVILTATSGDTGKAALAGFADVPGTKIIVFYPKHGVSPIQEKQMVTQEGDNTCVIGIEGNFDDAQNGVKKIFGDAAMREKLAAGGYQFSSANSINVGRLVPQIVYYVYAYGRLLKEGQIKPGEPVNVVVPTGNFGNILAAYYARTMGLPIDRLICASNENKVLYDFFRTGTYDRNREFILTSSPSMDILISSNLERLLYHAAGDNAEQTVKWMASLSKDGRYSIDTKMEAGFDAFVGYYATEQEGADQIRELFEQNGYLQDTHTSVASTALAAYIKETGDTKTAVIASTASPFKFTRSVMKALGKETEGKDDFMLADELHELSGLPVPEAVESIRTAPVRHTRVVKPEEMAEAVCDFLLK